jgi:hypothetical protein
MGGVYVDGEITPKERERALRKYIKRLIVLYIKNIWKIIKTRRTK